MIKERIEFRIKNGQRLVKELNQINHEQQILNEKKNKIIEEIIGNNEALKELQGLGE
jgi:hypothetical protein